jgi:protein-S-isoprenylcysteine O-methyltransferase Ste14
LTRNPYYWLHLAGLASVVFLFYWLVSAQRLKKVKQREAYVVRLVQVAFMALAYALVFNDIFGHAWLGRRFLPVSDAIGETGFAITVIGVAVAIWARSHLGENWSATVTLKEGHELIRSGPYRYVRRPICTGISLAFAGSVLAFGEFRGLISLAIAITSFYLKARKEERFLSEEFLETFNDHVRRRGMFLPSLGGHQ